MASAHDRSTIVPSGVVERAFHLLEIVVGNETSIGVRELSRISGVPKSSVGRLLAVLESLDMVQRSADGSARPGEGLARLLPARGRPAPDLAARVRPVLDALAAAHGEASALSIDDGDGVRYIEQVASPSPIQVPVSSGRHFPFHVVASGLVLMAQWDELRLDAYCEAGLETPTPQSISDADELRARLRYVRRRGYAWTDQELDLEVNGLAVPLRDRDGVVVAAVSLYGPAYRFAESLPGSMIAVDALKAAVAGIER